MGAGVGAARERAERAGARLAAAVVASAFAAAVVASAAAATALAAAATAAAANGVVSAVTASAAATVAAAACSVAAAAADPAAAASSTVVAAAAAAAAASAAQPAFLAARKATAPGLGSVYRRPTSTFGLGSSGTWPRRRFPLLGEVGELFRCLFMVAVISVVVVEVSCICTSEYQRGIWSRWIAYVNKNNASWARSEGKVGLRVYST